ncbi:hypothetical protein ACH5RR_032007 [Cinchona calisaya]|uniref:Uncharacterized protein n=1 Tax=Cinchona calisaya TaxID=153742 RepID=A0ABD2YKA6_9GENT
MAFVFDKDSINVNVPVAKADDFDLGAMAGFSGEMNIPTNSSTDNKGKAVISPAFELVDLDETLSSLRALMLGTLLVEAAKKSGFPFALAQVVELLSIMVWATIVTPIKNTGVREHLPKRKTSALDAPN